MNRMIWAAIGLITLTLCVSCSWWGQAVNKSQLSAAEYYAQARQYLERKDYVKAVNELKNFIRRFPESELVDKALLDLVKAHYENKEYPEATYELKRLTRDYPESPLVEDAQYYQAMCYWKQSRSSQLDQSETNSAIDEFNNYCNDFPQGKYLPEVKEHIKECREKLAKKDYDTAKLYFKQKDYAAAVIYCNTVINKYADTSWREKAEELLGLCEIRQKRI